MTRTRAAALLLASFSSTSYADTSHQTFDQQASINKGAEVYETSCITCHQTNGNGIPPHFPPLAGSEWIDSAKENLIRIQLRGLQGPITVKGKKYNGLMPPQSALSDEQIAGVLNYLRHTWGKNKESITPAEVKALRSEVGKPMVKAEDLIQP